jgi:hypothetical protein
LKVSGSERVSESLKLAHDHFGFVQDRCFTFPQDLFALEHRLHGTWVILLAIQLLRDLGQRLCANERISLFVACELMKELIRIRCPAHPAKKPGLE